MKIIAREYFFSVDIFETDRIVNKFYQLFSIGVLEIDAQIDGRVGENNSLSIDMTKQDDIKLLKLLACFKLPDL